MAITMFASLMRLYPYGGIRQCLFLAPGMALFVGVAFAAMQERIKPLLRTPATFVVVAVIAISMLRGTIIQWPYGEVEDTKSLLRYLNQNSSAGDQVWVNHDAVPAFDFYLPARDPRFIYGVYHQNSKDDVPELLSSIAPKTSRLWLVFSHLSQASDQVEEGLLLGSLSEAWDVRRVVAAKDADLYVAYRRKSQGQPGRGVLTQSTMVPTGRSALSRSVQVTGLTDEPGLLIFGSSDWQHRTLFDGATIHLGYHLLSDLK
jgi:hypothetical protein